MQLRPRYDGPPILSIEGSPGGQLEPLTRQRTRLQTMLGGLTEDQWSAQSRCERWSVRDVVAHLIGVNGFWTASFAAGIAGQPTTLVAGFDPAATPLAMVEAMHAMTSREVLDRFTESNDALFGVVTGIDAERWASLAEAPPGHVAMDSVARHAIWDSWVHERDIALPLGLAPVMEPDEVRSCLEYVAALSPALALGLGRECGGDYAVEATGPDIGFVLEVDESVMLRTIEPPADLPCLRGDAVSLVEALSLRSPMPTTAPMEWTTLLAGLEAAFDAV